MTPPRAAPLAPKQERSHATRRRLLDAAVDELVEGGYARLTTQAVARRAGVSRGAGQHHFPHKQTLVTQAVHHLAERQLVELRASIGAAPGGRARVQAALDCLFEQYAGRLFAASLELALAARGDPGLERVVADEEREVGRAMHALAGEVFAPDVVARREFAARWAMALSTIRGLAMLHVLGHPETVVARQWAYARDQVAESLLGAARAR